MKYKVILAFVFSLFLVFSARAQDISGAEKIVSFDGEIKINQNSTVDVEEIIAYDFGDAQKHGIYVYKAQGRRAGAGFLKRMGEAIRGNIQPAAGLVRGFVGAGIQCYNSLQHGF